MKKVFGNPIVVGLCLMVFPPLGIFFMFYFTEWTNGLKMALAVIFTGIFIFAIIQSMQQSAAEFAEQNLQVISQIMRI